MQTFLSDSLFKVSLASQDWQSRAESLFLARFNSERWVRRERLQLDCERVHRSRYLETLRTQYNNSQKTASSAVPSLRADIETLDMCGLGLDAGADALSAFSVDSELSIGLESLDLPVSSGSASRTLSPSASSSAMHRTGSSNSVGRMGLALAGESDAGAGQPKKVPPPRPSAPPKRPPPPNLSSAQPQQQCNNSTTIPKVASSSQLYNNAIGLSPQHQPQPVVYPSWDDPEPTASAVPPVVSRHVPPPPTSPKPPGLHGSQSFTWQRNSKLQMIDSNEESGAKHSVDDLLALSQSESDMHMWIGQAALQPTSGNSAQFSSSSSAPPMPPSKPHFSSPPTAPPPSRPSNSTAFSAPPPSAPPPALNSSPQHSSGPPPNLPPPPPPNRQASPFDADGAPNAEVSSLSSMSDMNIENEVDFEHGPAATGSGVEAEFGVISPTGSPSNFSAGDGYSEGDELGEWDGDASTPPASSGPPPSAPPPQLPPELPALNKSPSQSPPKMLPPTPPPPTLPPVAPARRLPPSVADASSVSPTIPSPPPPPPPRRRP